MSLSIGILPSFGATRSRMFCELCNAQVRDADNRWFDNGLSYAGKQGCCAFGAFSIVFLVMGGR